MNKKLLSVAVTISMLLSFLLAIPASAIPVPLAPEPVQAWNYTTTQDVTDIAVGDLNGDDKDDVVAIEAMRFTLTAIAGNNGTKLWDDPSMSGYAVAVGDINGDGWNEVIAGGWETVPTGGGNPGGESVGKRVSGWALNAYDKDGSLIWSYPTVDAVKDIEIGDIDGDGIDDVVACNDESGAEIYAVNGTGQNVTGWPVTISGEEFIDLAVGQLDGKGGMDVATIGRGGPGSLWVFNSTGDWMWGNATVPTIKGQAVEIGDVDGDGDNEVVAGTDDGRVLVYDGDEGGEPLYSFYTTGNVTDIELGDLDGNPKDVEVAAITSGVVATLFAIDIDNSPGAQLMWSYPISWSTQYYGESLAIGDVDRDYKNEVIAAGEYTDHKYVGPSCTYGVYAFDGIDRDGDGQGDLVWSPYCVGEPITDVEVGDLDGDGDKDVAFGTVGGDTVYAITAVESKTEAATGAGTVYFDSDPSTLANLTAVPESDLPEEGKPDIEFPYGFFSFNITLPSDNYTSAIVTITLPSPVPVGTQYWKYGPTPSNPTAHWYQLPIGDDDGDNVITITLFDGGLGDDIVVARDGLIVDPGGPGFRVPPVGGEAYPVSKISLLAPWMVLAVVLAGGISWFVLRRRRIQS